MYHAGISGLPYCREGLEAGHAFSPCIAYLAPSGVRDTRTPGSARGPVV